jgi:hypothetical protein
MTRKPHRRALACGAVALALLTFCLPSAAAKHLAAARVQLSVRWGGDAGSDNLRDDLERALAEHLSSTCFTSVVVADQPSPREDVELVLDVVLSGAVEETRFEDSIATALQPGDPGKELRVVARAAMALDAALTVRASGVLLSRKHINADVSRRPLYLGEDPQATAREGAIVAAVRALGKALGCGGAKLGHEVRLTLDEAKRAAAPAR